MAKNIGKIEVEVDKRRRVAEPQGVELCSYGMDDCFTCGHGECSCYEGDRSGDNE